MLVRVYRNHRDSAMQGTCVTVQVTLLLHLTEPEVCVCVCVFNLYFDLKRALYFEY